VGCGGDPFQCLDSRLDGLVQDLAELRKRLVVVEAKVAEPPATRVVRHVRNAEGVLVKSVLISGADGN
jgi:hypothetical protein